MGNSSFRLISNNMCYGPEPALSDEVEQYLTVSSSGRVWFSARNYLQYNEERGFCRKKQINIGAWKAGFLNHLVSRFEERPMATDCGSYYLQIRFEDLKMISYYIFTAGLTTIGLNNTPHWMPPLTGWQRRTRA